MNTRKAGLSSEFMCVISGQLLEICKIINKLEKYKTGTSRVVQRLRLLASTAGDMQNQDSVSRDMAKNK